MKADNELLEYLKRRYEFAIKGMEDNEPHSDDAFKHNWYQAQAATFKELIDILETELSGDSQALYWWQA